VGAGNGAHLAGARIDPADSVTGGKEQIATGAHCDPARYERSIDGESSVTVVGIDEDVDASLTRLVRV